MIGYLSLSVELGLVWVVFILFVYIFFYGLRCVCCIFGLFGRWLKTYVERERWEIVLGRVLELFLE